MKKRDLLIFTMLFASATSAYSKTSFECPPERNTSSTDCMRYKAEKLSTIVDKERILYLKKAKDRMRALYKDPEYQKMHDISEKEVMEKISIADNAFKKYRESQCDATYNYWDGHYKDFKYHECYIKITQNRTHEIWNDFLTYPDSTPPILPEPHLRSLSNLYD
ncbi:TPA: lysozyme inhibitor LprI family protein [Salmonella enterica subsp. enterica serovar Saintpaul]